MTTEQASVLAMTPAEAELMMEQARQEGWNPGIRDAVTFYRVNPNGLLCSHLDGKPIGFSSVMVYDRYYAFCGLYLVYKEFRGQGHGMEMTKKCLTIAGKRCIGLDGVINNINMYEEIGFQPTFRILRFLFSRENASSPRNFGVTTTWITNIPRQQLCSFDYSFFPAYRSHFLDIWCHQPGATALCALNNGKLVGYIVVRPCVLGSKVGPLFARSKEAAWALLSTAAESVLRWPLILDIPEPNSQAVTLASELRMELTSEVVRMHIGTPRSTDLSGVYSVTNLETG